VQGRPNVFLLSALVATSQENDDIASLLLEIHSMPWPVIYPQFANTFANCFDIPGVSHRKALDPDLDARSCANVSQVIQPFGKDLRLSDFNHGIKCSLLDTFCQLLQYQVSDIAMLSLPSG